MPAISNITSSTATSELSLAGVPLALRVHRRARRMRLRVARGGGGLVLTVPAGMSRRRALAWAAEHEGWARDALAQVPVAEPVSAGTTLLFRGEPLHIVWDAQLPRRAVRSEDRLEVGGPAEAVQRRVLAWLRGEALALLRAETRACAGKPDVPVSIGDARSRWGSCSARGAIRYNWRIVMAPDFVRAAIVAHEVAHLRHMDHSPRFHALVAELLGSDPAPAYGWLKREGATLHRIGAA